MKTRLTLLALLLVSGGALAQQKDMTFFVTSVGGSADLGGIAGADKRCQSLAAAAGSKRVWHAYLSTTGAKPVNARDRIGKGPWKNAKGEVIAKDLANLHANPNINRATALDEKGNIVNARVDKPNMHDILTGSRSDGRAFSGGDDSTCRNWTSGGEGAAMLGHHDRAGLREDAESKSWNASHFSRGCGHDALKATGGDGRFYCFAVK
ncbi:MAG TPA: hypothetical protein VF943_07055 [Burkholderiales bacterium]